MKKTSLKSVKRLNPYRGKVSVRGHRNHKGESMLQEPAPARAPKRHPSYSSDTRKLTRRHMDAVPHGPNESKRADTTPAQGVDHVPVCPGSASTETSAGSHPLTSSPQLLSVERGRQWKSLVEQGESLSKLARRAGCSKSQARDLVMLGSLPEDLEQGYLQGKLGRKKVLALARTRRKPVQEMQATDSGMQSQAAQSSGPAMTESQRQGEIDKYAKLVTDWVRSTNLGSCDWEPFFNQVVLALYGPLPWLYSKHAPRRNEIRPDQDSLHVIKRCKPKMEAELFVPDFINKHVEWLARWIQILVPDKELMKEALDRGKAVLTHEAWGAPR